MKASLALDLGFPPAFVEPRCTRTRPIFASCGRRPAWTENGCASYRSIAFAGSEVCSNVAMRRAQRIEPSGDAMTGESGDVVYGCVANQHTLPQAVKIALIGAVVVLGGARRPATIDFGTGVPRPHLGGWC